ncbi:MAG: ferritin family protein [Phycisphaerae bacterium]|nr:ferritin family protein [Phycisphaerae bacterium]
MSVTFTALEIFEIAEQIERNGAKFYHQAAEKTGDKSMSRFFSQLAEMENNHEKIFSEMKEKIKAGVEGAVVFDPNAEIAYYLKAIGASAGWEGKALPRLSFSGKETPAQILRAAIAAERYSIDYYLGLKEMVPQADKKSIDVIIKEEMGHVVTLQKNLEQIK